MSSCPGEIQCSGHGLCSTSTNRCACDLGWESGDCSELSCPLGLSWSVTHLAYHNPNRNHNCSSYPVSPKSRSMSSLNSRHETQLLITLLYLSLCLPVCLSLSISSSNHPLTFSCSLLLPVRFDYPSSNNVAHTSLSTCSDMGLCDSSTGESYNMVILDGD